MKLTGGISQLVKSSEKQAFADIPSSQLGDCCLNSFTMVRHTGLSQNVHLIILSEMVLCPNVTSAIIVHACCRLLVEANGMYHKQRRTVETSRSLSCQHLSFPS